MTSIVKTKTEIDPKILGELGLHVVSYNDMPEDQWLAKFNTLEVAEYMLADEGSFFARLNPDVSEKARTALMNHITYLQEGGTLVANEPVQTMTFAGKQPQLTQESAARVSANIQTLPHREPPVGQPAAAVGVISGAETIDTDKGTFYCLDALENKLAGIYVKANVVADFNTSFLKAMVAAKVEPGMDYISESKKKALTKELTTLMMEGV